MKTFALFIISFALAVLFFCLAYDASVTLKEVYKLYFYCTLSGGFTGYGLFSMIKLIKENWYDSEY